MPQISVIKPKKMTPPKKGPSQKPMPKPASPGQMPMKPPMKPMAPKRVM